MNIKFFACIALTLFFTALSATDNPAPNFSKEQSLMRGHHAKARSLFDLLHQSATARFSSEITPNGESGISQEFLSAHKNILALEGEIHVIPSQHGKSRIWSARRRHDSYEPRLAFDNYLSGPEKDLIIFNREYVDSITDFSLPSRGGIGFSMKRVYYSALHYEGPMGKGWDFSYNARIILDTASSNAMMHLNGIAYKFYKDGGKWRSAAGNFFLLKEDGEHLYVYDSSLSRMEFEKSQEIGNAYRLSALASRHSGYSVNRISIIYQEKSDRIKHVLDPYGNKIIFSYDNFGRIIQISAVNISIDYAYDSEGNLSEVKTAPIAISFDSALPYCTKYRYVKKADQYLLVEKHNNSSSSHYCIEYDENGAVSRIGKKSPDIDAMWTVKGTGNVVKIQPATPAPVIEYNFASPVCRDLPSVISVPALNAKTSLTFTPSGLIQSSIDPLGIKKEYRYDSENEIPYLRMNLLSVTTWPISDPQRSTKARLVDSFTYVSGTAFVSSKQFVEYDESGKQNTLSTQSFEYTKDWDISIENSDGIVTRFFYNKYGSRAIILDANHRATIFYYGSAWPDKNSIYAFSDGEIHGNGLCVKTISDATKEQLDDACAALGMSQFIFNDLLRVQPVSDVTRFCYDSMGNLSCIKKKNKTAYTLKNRSGNILAEYTTGKGKKITGYDKNLLPNIILHQFVPETGAPYQGTENTTFSGRFFTESFHYDSAERIDAHRSTDEEFNGRSVVFSYKRYPNGLLQNISDPMGLVRHDEYSVAGLLLKQTLKGESSVTLSSISGYFPNGAIRKSCDALGDMTENYLDGYGRVSAITLADGTKKQIQYDGLGRILTESRYTQGREISRIEFVYGKFGKVETIYEYQISDSLRKKILKEQFVYDDAGNLVAHRGIQNDSWSYFLLDGLNRSVAVRKPSGDITISIYDSDSLVFSYEKNLIEKNKYRCNGTLYLRDQLGFPSVILPVDADHKIVEARRIVHRYNFIGQEVSTTQFQQRTQKRYNSLGLVSQESTTPLSKNFGELPLVTHYSFNAAGQIVQKIVDNNALAIFAPKDNAVSKIVPAPQTTTYTYDDLSRQSTIQQPDGLIVQKVYNEHSLPVKMIWTHASQPKNVLRFLHLKYAPLARLVSISDGLNNRVLREYSYDGLGNCVLAKDFSAADSVETHRSFDSLGNLLSEHLLIGQLKLPGIQVEYEPALGEERISFDHLPPKSVANWSYQTIRRDSLGKTISISLDASRTPFAAWDYVGALPSCRKIPESLITVRHTYSSQNDLIRTDLFEKSNRFGSLQYAYDAAGNNVYSSTALAESSINSYSFAQYLGYNAFRQLVEENGESSIPHDSEIMNRREQLFSGQRSIQATKTTRRVYDQADNMWALYFGSRLPAIRPDAFSKDNLSQFLSPAGILADKEHISQQALWELASNRDTTQAHFSAEGKLTADSNVYDNLGNLQEYTGDFWNGARSIPVLWKLKFDTMGRLVTMHAYAESDFSFHQKGDLIAELSFMYDANNRRVKKSVKDFSRSKNVLAKHEFTSYIGNNQTLVLKEKSGKFELREQYLWNPGTRELLMAALPESVAENKNSVVFRRYFFQQDRGLNTICVTKNVNGRAALVSGASYLGFGKNATSAKILSIDTSMKEDSAGRFDAAYNGKLDDNQFSRWENSPDRPQYLEVKLSKSGDLSSLKIWTDDKFPTNFLVFVLPVGADSPNTTHDLATWCNDAMNKGYCVYQQKDAPAATAEKPVVAPLFNISGNRIVLLWDSHKEKEIAIREIEVTQMPNNPGAIAYAGQWLDRETNMYYQINRYKLAGSSKFISPDPIGFLDGNNLYAYAKNNPLEWHDPNGEWAHILLGALAGAVINSGVYAIQCWITGEDFSWKELAIKAGTGALAGGIAAATFGAVNPLLAGWGFNAAANIVISSASAGFTSGFASGSVDTLLHGGGFKDALMTGLSSGGWGAAGGAVSGGVLSYTGASFGGVVLSGAAGGGSVGAVKSGWDAYEQTGDWTEAGWAALEGGWKGSAFGAVVAGSAWGVGRVTERIVPLKGYPEHMTDPRSKGILIKTKPGERTYGGLPAKPGYQRQHIKPLSLGGRDVPSNIEYMRNELHSTNPALGGGPQNAHPGAYVNSKPLGTIFY